MRKKSYRISACDDLVVDRRSGHIMTRRNFLKAAGMGGLSVTAGDLVGCGGGSDAENGELNLFIWTEYVPESLISDFEDEYSVKVNTTMYSSNEDMLSKYIAGDSDAYDLLLPTGYMVERLINQGLLQEFDTGRLENFGNISTQYLDQTYDPGNVYSVPWMVAITALGYDTGFLDKPTSWDVLWDEKCENSLVVLNDAREILGMVQRTLGMSGNETDELALAEVGEKIIELKPNIKLYDSDSPKSALITGDARAGVMWSGEIALAAQENPNITAAHPVEGCAMGIDNWVIPADARNVDNAYLFVDFLMRAESGKRMCEEYPYVSPNTAAIELMDDDYINDPVRNLPATVIEQAWAFENIDTDSLALYNDIWTKLKQ